MAFDSNQNTFDEVDRNTDKNDDVVVVSSKKTSSLAIPVFADEEVDIAEVDDKSVSLKSGIIFPTGRRPFCIVPGLDYDLEDGIIVEEEDLEESPAKPGDLKFRSRKESYLVNSFVCENGYLSEDEVMSTPVADWKTKRDKIVKNKKDSEKKRWKLKIKSQNCPELINNTTSKSSKSTKMKMKKYQAIKFTAHSIQTGLSVEYQLMQGVQNNNNSTQFERILSPEDRSLALKIALSAMNENNDNRDCRKNIERMIVGDSQVVHDNTDDVVHVHDDDNDVLQTVDDLEVDAKCMKIASEKHNLYYLVKNKAKNIMQRSENIPSSPEQLLRELISNIPNFSSQPKQFQIENSAKFFFKFLK